jgi:hypothetical protein
MEGLRNRVLEAMYRLRTAATVRTRTCFCEHVIMSCSLVPPLFACQSAIEDKTKNVLDVGVGESLVCFAPIVELIVPILSRSSDGYAACLYLVGLK